MQAEHLSTTATAHGERWVNRLERAHRGRYRPVLIAALLGICAFTIWAMVFQIDEVARAVGEVVTESRVQVIQSVDGGVLAELLVREGDRVAPDQVLARLDQTRFASSVAEIRVRLNALNAKVARLRAEVVGAPDVEFLDDLETVAPMSTRVERALFDQRRTGLSDELRTLSVAVDLARRELELVKTLHDNGDASGAELLRAERGLNEAEASRVNRRNRFLEAARLELTEAEDEIAQSKQLLIRRREAQSDSVFTAVVPGIVKNIRVTTVGGVLGPGEVLMQIVPVEGDLLIEARVSPADIGRVVPGLPVNLRFDAFDFTIYGAVRGTVTYVSADTMKEATEEGTAVYYQVRVKSDDPEVRTTTGRKLTLVPGMTTVVDIRTGRRSLMDVLLKPLWKTRNEAFSER